ncbi:MAG: LPS assembly lipoprotein LptE [Thermodesulfobacteriota bacterium]
MAAAAGTSFKYTVVICCIAFFAACGYRFSGGGELPGGFESLSIETFKNRTGEIGIESIITNDITYEFTRTAKADISDRDEAEAVLTGEIRSARSSTISHVTAHTTGERRITVTVDVKLLDSSGEVLWSSRGISASEEYDASGDKLASEQNKKSAIAKLSGKLAERIYYRMTDDF